MKNKIQLNRILMLAAVYGVAISASAQSINLWRGDATKSDWSDPYKWKLKHVPMGEESVHFRSPHAVVVVNSTVELDNGMMLYGQDLFLQGNGNINMWSPIEHKRTVNIPASSTGHANLTISDNLSLNGQIALAAKSFGNSATKGSVTLKDHATVSGKLTIGNNGVGSGQIFIRDQSVYRIQGLDLKTLAKKGGVSELHIMGGTVHIDVKTNPFEAFLEDSSRKIIIGDDGQLTINSALSIQHKKNIISKMISEKRISAAQGCELMTPIFHRDMIFMQARISVDPHSTPALLANIQNAAETKSSPIPTATDAPKSNAGAQTSRLESLLKDMKSTESNRAVSSTRTNDESGAPETKDTAAPLAGYIVFFSAALFLLRPAKSE